MKKIISIISVILIIFLLSGCTSEKYDGQYTGVGKLVCTREGTVPNSEAEFNYTIAYNNGNILTLYSQEKITSDDESILNTYEEAYKKIYKPYKNLEYYTNEVTRYDNVVISETYIEYDKVNLNKLEELENSEQTIIENGKAKVDKWISFAKQIGVTCEKQ